MQSHTNGYTQRHVRKTRTPWHWRCMNTQGMYCTVKNKCASKIKTSRTAAHTLSLTRAHEHSTWSIVNRIHSMYTHALGKIHIHIINNIHEYATWNKWKNIQSRMVQFEITHYCTWHTYTHNICTRICILYIYIYTCMHTYSKTSCIHAYTQVSQYMPSLTLNWASWNSASICCLNFLISASASSLACLIRAVFSAHHTQEKIQSHFRHAVCTKPMIHSTLWRRISDVMDEFNLILADDAWPTQPEYRRAYVHTKSVLYAAVKIHAHSLDRE